MGRGDPDWIVLAADRSANLGRIGTGAAHRRRSAGFSQSCCSFATREASNPGIALAAVWGAVAAATWLSRPRDRELRCNHSNPQHSILNRLMILAALIESLFGA